jgi:hypothetical protein
MVKKNAKLKIFLLFSVFYFLFSVSAYAQSLSLSTSKSSYNVGDSFSVSLILNAGGNNINTISGKIIVPTDKFQIVDVRYGNSVVSLWVEQPKINYANGSIAFAGGVPGGFSGSNGPILTFALKTKITGQGIVNLQDIKILLNDGQGTELKNITLKNLALNISQASKNVATPPSKEIPQEVYLPQADTIPPELFIPLISQNPSIQNNKYFVSFFAVDKNTGVDHYEIREEPFILSSISKKFIIDWQEGKSPYVLFYQLWRAKILGRAYDQAGNYTEESVEKPFDQIVIWVFAAAILIVVISYLKFKGRKTKTRKIK